MGAECSTSSPARPRLCALAALTRLAFGVRGPRVFCAARAVTTNKPAPGRVSCSGITPRRRDETREIIVRSRFNMFVLALVAVLVPSALLAASAASGETGERVAAGRLAHRAVPKRARVRHDRLVEQRPNEPQLPVAALQRDRQRMREHHRRDRRLLHAGRSRRRTHARLQGHRDQRRRLRLRPPRPRPA